MLDMGFGPEIRKIVEELGTPPKTERQTLMFSATFPEEIQKMAGDFLNDYLFLTVGRVGGACTDVTQTVLEVDRQEKRSRLCDILTETGIVHSCCTENGLSDCAFMFNMIKIFGFDFRVRKNVSICGTKEKCRFPGIIPVAKRIPDNQYSWVRTFYIETLNCFQCVLPENLAIFWQLYLNSMYQNNNVFISHV